MSWLGLSSARIHSNQKVLTADVRYNHKCRQNLNADDAGSNGSTLINKKPQGGGQGRN